MTKKYKTEQEAFWSGEFGTSYIERNIGKKLLAGNIHFFSKILSRTTGVNSLIEFGANVGMNLKALRQLLPGAELAGIEINEQAYAELVKDSDIKGYSTSILDFNESRQWNFVLIKGVLIHINPDELPAVYDKLYEASDNYVCIAEYYNPTPVSLNYRGHEGKLFKRDFAGEMMDRFPDLSLEDYGFAYRRDNLFPQDDITWFLLKKTKK
jgi:pseudaminic acid biosynthesis-associated methylase